MRKKLFFIFGFFFFIFLGSVLYFFVGSAPAQKDIAWGVNFSQMHAEHLTLDWRAVYAALFDDLGARRIKIAVQWDFIEGDAQDEYFFNDIDWQVREAEQRNAKLLLAIGMKTPRWPECHIPQWAKNLSKEDQQKQILELLQAIVGRYRNSPAIWGWQVENEPFFAFGECPWADSAFYRKEIALVKSLDPDHPVVATTSGEGSFWTRAARTGDIVGTTLYRKVWFRQLNLYVNYPFPPVFYWRKVQLINTFFGKEVIGVELQAEPWGPKLLYDLSLEEQMRTMNLSQFQKNIEFAKRTGLKEFYLWGAEWWYWLKETQNNPAIWDEAEKLFPSTQY